MEKAAGYTLPPFLCVPAPGWLLLGRRRRLLRGGFPAEPVLRGAVPAPGVPPPAGRSARAVGQGSAARSSGSGGLPGCAGRSAEAPMSAASPALTGPRCRGGRSLRYRGPGLRTGSVPRPGPGPLRPGRSGRRRAVRPEPPRHFAARWFERSGPVPAAAAGFQPRSAGSAGLRRLADVGCSQAPGGRR